MARREGPWAAPVASDARQMAQVRPDAAIGETVVVTAYLTKRSRSGVVVTR